MKNWSGIPRCGTNAIFHTRNGLDIPSISSLYEEAHCVSHAATRLKGDATVNHILDCRVERESAWTRKGSTTVRAEEVYNEALQQTTVAGYIPEGDRWERQRNNAITEVKEAVKSQVRYDNEKHWGDHIKKLIKQGELLELAKCQNTDLTWKSYIFNLKKGTLKFILNATIDCLPHNANLRQWGRSQTDSCPLPGCGLRQTTAHILSNCKTALNQLRYNFRHDSVLTYISQVLDKSRFEAYVDIPGHKTANNGTIPAHVGIVSLDRPDIVVLDNNSKKIFYFELTCPNEKNESDAHLRKQNKYAYLLTDTTSYSPSVIPFEIGSKGYVSKPNNDRLKTLHKFCKKGLKLKTFVDTISAIAVNCSYFIFLNRNEPNWPEVPPLTSPFTHANSNTT